MKRLLLVLVVLASVTAGAFSASEGEVDDSGSGFVRAVDSGPGILISSVLEDSPAERAGLIRGDILLQVDGTDVESTAELRDFFADYDAGADVVLTISRGGEEREVAATLETRLYRPALGIEGAGPRGAQYGGRSELRLGRGPLGESPDGERGYRGERERFEYRFDDGPGSRGMLRFGFGPELFEYFGEEIPQGDVITGVMEDGPAAAAGLQRFDIVTGVDGVDISRETLADIVSDRSPGDRLELDVLRVVDANGDQLDEPETLSVTVELGETERGDALLGVSFFAMRPRIPDDSRVFNGRPSSSIDGPEGTTL